MEKQKKVLKKINYSNGQTTPVGTPKNDECYTPLQPIINELSKYDKNHFYMKDGLSPFDWDIFSKHPEIYGIKITFNSDGEIDEVFNLTSDENHRMCPNNWSFINISYDHENNKFMINGKDEYGPRCNFIKAIIMQAKIWKPKSWTFSGYNPFLKKGIDYSTYDFSKYDVVITNPAFSLIKDFLNKLINEKVDFIILSDFLSRGNPRVGLHLQKKECYLGFNVQQHISFQNWNIDSNTMVCNKIVNVDWVTSYKDAYNKRCNRSFKTGISYEVYKDDYPILNEVRMKDGTNPIKINKCTILPDDYYDWFISSVGALDYIDNGEFEWYCTSFVAWHNENPDKSPFDFNSLGGKYNQGKIVYNNKPIFASVIARRIKK